MKRDSTLQSSQKFYSKRDKLNIKYNLYVNIYTISILMFLYFLNAPPN